MEAELDSAWVLLVFDTELDLTLEVANSEAVSLTVDVFDVLEGKASDELTAHAFDVV
jgi:hypothetical protein